MRASVSLVQVVALLAICGPASGQRETRADLVITAVSVVDGEGNATAQRTVVVRGGAVAELLAPGAPAPGAEVTIDGRGKFLIPGLWDMHVHLAARPEPRLAEAIMLPLFLAHGIVGVRDMGGPLDRLLALREQVKSGSLTGPVILTPGPFVDGAGDADPMFRRAPGPDEARDAVRSLVESGVDFVKVQATLSRPAYDGLMAEARSRTVVVAGHVPIALSASDVVEAGQRSLEHISPALPGDAGLLFACSSREAALRDELLAIERDRPTAKPEAIRAREAALRAELVRSYDGGRAAAIGGLLKRHQTWIVPTMIWSNSFRPLHAEDDGREVPLEYVPADTRKRWQDARARYLEAAPPEAFTAAASVAAASARAVGHLQDAGARVLAGTDTFDGFVLPGVSLHQELALLNAAGLSPLQALQAATRNAAEFRGTLDREGTIARGKRADLVLLDADPLASIRNLSKVHAVITRGRVLTRADLDALLRSAREAAK